MSASCSRRQPVFTPPDKRRISAALTGRIGAGSYTWGPAGRSGWALAWLLPPALFLEPVRNTLAFGQVNVILMALVSADCLLAAPRWPRGVLVGRLRDGSSVVASAGAGPGTALGSLGAGRGKRLRGFRRARPAAVRIRAAHPPRGRRRPAAP
ncbi:MAG: glycosyltransferase family 87 protein [Streptosporangiaceae bacterium]